MPRPRRVINTRRNDNPVASEASATIDEQAWKAKRGEIAVELAKVLLARVSLSDAATLEKLPSLAVTTADRLMVVNWNVPVPTFTSMPTTNDGERL